MPRNRTVQLRTKSIFGCRRGRPGLADAPLLSSTCPFVIPSPVSFLLQGDASGAAYFPQGIEKGRGARDAGARRRPCFRASTTYSLHRYPGGCGGLGREI